MAWGGRHRATHSRVFKHAVCGTPLDDARILPYCELTPAPEIVIAEPARSAAAARGPGRGRAARPHRLLEPLET